LTAILLCNGITAHDSRLMAKGECFLAPLGGLGVRLTEMKSINRKGRKGLRRAQAYAENRKGRKVIAENRREKSMKLYRINPPLGGLGGKKIVRRTNTEFHRGLRQAQAAQSSTEDLHLWPSGFRLFPK